MRQIENEFRYKGVDFKVLKRGQKALMLEAKADFYPDNCVSYEVWQLRHSKDVEINGVLVSAGERKPNDNDYPYSSHQFMSYLYTGTQQEKEKTVLEKAKKRFNEYETGIRPKKLTKDSVV